MDKKKKKFRKFEYDPNLAKSFSLFTQKIAKGFKKIPEKHPTFFYVPGKGFVKKDEKGDH